MSTRTFEAIYETYRNARQTGDIAQLTSLLNELEELNSTEATALVKRTQGSILRLQGNYSAALEFHFEAYSFYELNGKNEAKAASASDIAAIYHRTGEFAKALEWMHKTLEFHDKTSNMEGVAAETNNIGNIFLDTGDYAKALDYYHRALTLHTQVGNRFYQANTIGNLGLVYKAIGELPTALEYAQQALVLHQELGNRSGESTTMSNIGAILADMKQFDEAEPWIRRAIAHAKENGLSHQLPVHSQQLAYVLYKMNRADEAVTILDEHSSVLWQHASAYSSSMVVRAQIQAESGNPLAARELLLIALEQTAKRNERSSMMEITKFLRDISKTLGDLDSYVKYNESYLEIANEVRGAESTRRLTMQEKERELEIERQSRAREQEAQEREREKERSILYGALPKHVAERLIRGETVTDHYDNASVMFIDIAGFTRISSHLPAGHVVHLLDAIFGVCDEICQKYGVTKIKTIGDSYMAVAFGEMPNAERQMPNSIVAIANAALQIIERIKELDFNSLLSLQVPSTSSSDYERLQVPSISSSSIESLSVALRVGLPCGPITAGVLGKERLQYDVWGDTVNVASRMESTCEPGRVQVSEQFARTLSLLSVKERGLGESSRETAKEWGPGESSLMLTPRGETEIKGKGMMQTYWLERA